MSKKRKLDEIASDDNSIYPSKQSKMSQEDGGEKNVLYLIPHSLDKRVSHILVEFWKIDCRSLVALSLTCSGWHNFLNLEMDKDLRHALPLSYKEYNKRTRNDALQEFYAKPSSILDLQLFEFKEKLPAAWLDVSDVLSVPWAPHIIFVTAEYCFGIFDLKQGKVVQPFTPDVEEEQQEYYLRSIAVNAQRKQVLISNIVRDTDAEDSDDNEDKGFMENTGDVHYSEWLHVYNVDDNGSVELATKFCSKNENELMHTGPVRLLLTDDGIIWYSLDLVLRRFSLEKNCEIDTSFDLNGLQVLGMGETDARVLIFCTEFPASEGYAISVYDTTAEKFLETVELGAKRNGDQESEVRIALQNRWAVLIKKLISVHELDDFSLQREISLLLDRRAHYWTGPIVRLIEKSNKIFFCYPSIGVIDESVTKITEDFLFSLPRKTNDGMFSEVSVVDKTVFIADQADSRLLIYKLTL